MIFIASPYTVPHGTPEERKKIREARYQAALEHAGSLATQEIQCYSPIVHWHEVAKTFSLPKENEFWKKFNRKQLLMSRKVHVLTLPGWRSSEGVAWERKEAAKNNIPVETVDPSLGTVQRQTHLLNDAKPS
ncbi:MAG: DUF1937 family protein [Candidatus Aenigmatarchaeota archaeon]